MRCIGLLAVRLYTLFCFVGGGEGIGYRCMVRYLYRWDSDISDRVYRIRVRLCDKRYLILFVGWGECLWAWYIFSLRMRIRMVTRDRIPLSM